MQIVVEAAFVAQRHTCTRTNTNTHTHTHTQTNKQNLTHEWQQSTELIKVQFATSIRIAGFELTLHIGKVFSIGERVVPRLVCRRGGWLADSLSSEHHSEWGHAHKNSTLTLQHEGESILSERRDEVFEILQQEQIRTHARQRGMRTCGGTAAAEKPEPGIGAAIAL